MKAETRRQAERPVDRPGKPAGRADSARRRADRNHAARPSAEPQPRTRRAPHAKRAEARDKRPVRTAPQTTQVRRPAPPTSTTQAKARAKARKAKAPKALRVPLGDRLIARLAAIELRPRALAAKVPFVVLVIGSLGLGLGATLWLSTDSAERSYELGNAREANRVLTQQKESLERDVLAAQSAPALADAARNLGMIPSRDTAHLVQDPAGNWVVVGQAKPAEGAPPPPLNTKLPDPVPPPPPVNRTEMPVRVTPPPAPPGAPAAAGVPGGTAADAAPQSGPVAGGPAAVAGAPVPGGPAAVAVVPGAPQPANPPAAPTGGEQSVGVAPPPAGPPR